MHIPEQVKILIKNGLKKTPLRFFLFFLSVIHVNGLP